MSVGVALLVFLPWQLYAWFKFPSEYLYEIALNTKHFFESVEGHDGEWWFHFDAVKQLYGSGTFVPVIIALSLFVFYKRIQPLHRIFFISFIIFVYTYFSIAATKMTSYCIIVCPVIFLGMGAFTDLSLSYAEKKLIPVFKTASRLAFHVLTVAVLITISILLLRMNKIERSHTMKKPLDNHQREKWLGEFEMIKKIHSQLPNRNYVLFNCPQFMNIPIMFFTDVAAYDFLPDKKQLEKVRAKGIRVAVYNDGALPEWIKYNALVIEK